MLRNFRAHSFAESQHYYCYLNLENRRTYTVYIFCPYLELLTELRCSVVLPVVQTHVVCKYNNIFSRKMLL
jgi:hypothetical protein